MQNFCLVTVENYAFVMVLWIRLSQVIYHSYQSFIYTIIDWPWGLRENSFQQIQGVNHINLILFS